jgi:hypothetical protein
MLLPLLLLLLPGNTILERADSIPQFVPFKERV